MAFPSTPIIDSFQRSNETPVSDGERWTFRSSQGLNLSSKLLVCALAVASHSVRTTPSEMTNMESYVTINSMTNVSDLFITCRVQAGTTASNISCYSGRYQVSSTSIFVQRIDNGSFGLAPKSDLQVITALGAGDKLGVKCDGQVIRVWVYQAGVWTPGPSLTDGLYTSGFIGVSTSQSTTGGRFLDFGGGIPITEADTPKPVAGRGATW
jgi:hypothetical protein